MWDVYILTTLGLGSSCHFDELYYDLEPILHGTSNIISTSGNTQSLTYSAVRIDFAKCRHYKLIISCIKSSRDYGLQIRIVRTRPQVHNLIEQINPQLSPRIHTTKSPTRIGRLPP